MKRAISLFVFLLVATQGCGPTKVLYKPDVDPAQMEKDQRECKEKAVLWTGDGPYIGSRRSELDRNYEDCMEGKGYKWGDEKSVPPSTIVPPAL